MVTSNSIVDKWKITNEKKYGKDWSKNIAEKSKKSYFENHKKNNKELYEKTDFLVERYPNLSTTQRNWHFKNNLFDFVYCKICKINLAPFDKKHQIYGCCSKECKSKMFSDLAKKSMDNQDIKDKIRNTFIKKYGSENPYAVIGKSAIKTIKERYGEQYTSTSQVPQFRQASLDRFANTFINNHLVEGYEYVKRENKIFTLKHTECGNEFEINQGTYLTRKRIGAIICTNCYPIWSGSSNENKLADYIESIYGGKIERNSRKPLDYKFEMDIWLPELKIGIEFNGCWWHSENYKSKNYHQEKWKFAKERGIRMIQIWEDKWENHRESQESILKTVLNHSGITKIGARKCEIKEIQSKIEREFIDKNHNQKYVPSSMCYGLHFDGKLLQIMSIVKRKNNNYEIARICTESGYVISGGSSRLFDFIIKKHIEIINLISYCDLDLFTGKVYENMGMNFVKYTKPGYFYVTMKDRYKFCHDRINRTKFQKHKLLKKYPEFYSNMTELEIANKLGYIRVWNTGNALYEWKRNPKNDFAES